LITSGELVSTGCLPQPLPHPVWKRGEINYPLDAWDIISFGLSAERWVTSEIPLVSTKPSLAEVIRMLHLVPDIASQYYARRPLTYLKSFLECPKCGSINDAKTCRNCHGRPRVSRSETSPWAPGSSYCLAWSSEMRSTGRRVIADDLWLRAEAASKRLKESPPAQAFESSCAKQLRLHGIWHDAATGIDIPLRTVLAYAPAASGPFGDALGSISVVANASHGAWAASAGYHSSHIAAAFKQDLFAAVTGSSRPHHVWLLIEEHEPFITARRRTTPAMLDLGRRALSSLMASYAQCLATGIWPSFDPPVVNSLDAFSPFAFLTEPSCNNGSIPDFSHYAPPSCHADI